MAFEWVAELPVAVQLAGVGTASMGAGAWGMAKILTPIYKHQIDTLKSRADKAEAHARQSEEHAKACAEICAGYREEAAAALAELRVIRVNMGFMLAKTNDASGLTD